MKSKLLLAIVVLAVTAVDAHTEDVVGRRIESWQPGMLDIHQISTGRGNAGLYVFPDGTTLLVDVGELNGPSPKHTPARPDDTHRPASGSSATCVTPCSTTRSRRSTTCC